jgi:hypothetical protein
MSSYVNAEIDRMCPCSAQGGADRYNDAARMCITLADGRGRPTGDRVA